MQGFLIFKIAKKSNVFVTQSTKYVLKIYKAESKTLWREAMKAKNNLHHVDKTFVSTKKFSIFRLHFNTYQYVYVATSNGKRKISGFRHAYDRSGIKKYHFR